MAQTEQLADNYNKTASWLCRNDAERYGGLFVHEGLMHGQRVDVCGCSYQVNMPHLGFHCLLVSIVVGPEELPEGKLLPLHVLVGRHHLRLQRKRVVGA